MKKTVFFLSLLILLNSCEMDDINSPTLKKPTIDYTDFMINAPYDSDYIYSFVLNDLNYNDDGYSFGLNGKIKFVPTDFPLIYFGNIFLGNTQLLFSEFSGYLLPEYFTQDSLSIFKDSLRGKYQTLHIPANSTYDMPEVNEEVYIVKPFEFLTDIPDIISINEGLTLEWETDSIASDIIIIIDNYLIAELGDERYDTETFSDSGQYTISSNLLKEYAGTGWISITIIREKATHDNIAGFPFRFLSYSFAKYYFYLTD